MRKPIISLIFLLTFACTAYAASPDDMRPDAPDRYTVVPGDTLWSISSRLLKSPWRWPELWEMNRAQIRNPHRIYPGDVIVLERKGSEVFARLETTRLSPQVRVEMVESASIPSGSIAAVRSPSAGVRSPSAGVSRTAAGARGDRQASPESA